MTRCSTATAAKNKSQGGLCREPVVSQLHPDVTGPSLSPASFASAPASLIFGTHAWALHVSFVLHCASVLHPTHLPLGTSHT